MQESRGVFGTPSKEHRVRRWQDFEGIYAWFLGLQVLDLGSTLAVIQAGGVEANPFGPAQWVAAEGVVALFWAKLAVIALTAMSWFAAMAWVERHEPERYGRVAAVVLALMMVAMLVYVVVVFQNLALLAALRA